MLISRGIAALRAAKLLKFNKANNLQCQRLSHDYNYRCGGPPASKNIMLAAEFVGGFAWWWVLWHLWTEPGHITGEFVYPNPKEWTDEELGIPPRN